MFNKARKYKTLTLRNFTVFVTLTADFLFKLTFSKYMSSFRNTIRVLQIGPRSEALQYVGPDLGPNWFQRLPVGVKVATNYSGIGQKE